MARFAEWAKSKAPDPAQGYIEAAVEAAPPAEETLHYLIDNSQLKSRSRGIHYRRSPVIEDKRRSTYGSRRPAEFGTVVKGTPHGDDWVRVKKNFYLPRRLAGVVVLIPGWWPDNQEGEMEDIPDSPRRNENNTLGNLMDRYEDATKSLVDRCEDATKRLLKGQRRTEDTPPVREFCDMDAFETSDVRPGTGAMFTVVCDKVLIRATPSTNAKLRNYKTRGESIELFEWDETRQWRRCFDTLRETEVSIVGWMMLDHPEFGALLRPEGFEKCRAIFSPVCAAVLENDIDNLTQFIAEGMVVNALGEGAPSPLVLAAEEGRLECCVLLLQAHADVDLNSIVEGDAKVLMKALARGGGPIQGDFNMDAFEKVMEVLPPEIHVIADRLFEQATAVQAKLVSVEPPTQAAAHQAPLSPHGIVNAAELPTCREEDPALEAVPGVEYQVVHDAVWIRAEPKPTGAQLGMRTRGQVVEMFEYDASMTWRRVRTGGVGRQHVKDLFEPEGDGWMLIKHPKLGDLLQPVARDAVG